ncbi:hypothetical protein cyc_04613 [Cyclospora cayetanensis]|uniref:PX domain-containing protein n=1 Tax=Cyclospora cayetanensis TaxID=88456 RepID=A0A1D3D4C4_9EIME|nr:hypothetical protein cyc_04613 [Cyclospora cayetanensis]
MGLSCTPARLPATFQLKKFCTAALAALYLALLLVLVCWLSHPPPVLVWSLGTRSVLWMVLATAILLRPNDLPLELLPFVSRLLTQGTAHLPFYTLPSPHPSGFAREEAGATTLTALSPLAAPNRPLEAGGATGISAEKEVLANASFSSAALSATGFSSVPPLEVSIQSVVLTEVPLSPFVHAEYKLQHQLSLQYLESRRRGLESFLKGVVAEPAFWISALLVFLDIPEHLRGALAGERLFRLNELQRLPQRAAKGEPHGHVQAASSSSSRASSSAPYKRFPGDGVPLPFTSICQPSSRRWYYSSGTSRTDASEDAFSDVAMGICAGPEIFRLRIFRDGGKPFVVHDLKTTTREGIFYAARRYSEFIDLRQQLQQSLCVELSPLPGRLMSSKRNYLFHEQRRQRLELWLKQVLSDAACAESPPVLMFLGVLEYFCNDYLHSSLIVCSLLYRSMHNEATAVRRKRSESSPFSTFDSVRAATTPKPAHCLLEKDCALERDGRLPSYLASIASIHQREGDKVLRLLILRSDERRERNWEVEITEKEIKALRATLCALFDSPEISLVPRLPSKGFRLLSSGEVCRNYPVRMICRITFALTLRIGRNKSPKRLTTKTRLPSPADFHEAQRGRRQTQLPLFSRSSSSPLSQDTVEESMAGGERIVNHKLKAIRSSWRHEKTHAIRDLWTPHRKDRRTLPSAAHTHRMRNRAANSNGGEGIPWEAVFMGGMGNSSPAHLLRRAAKASRTDDTNAIAKNDTKKVPCRNKRTWALRKGEAAKE